MRTSPFPPARRDWSTAQSGFTLVEIILAIGLATGLLLIALTFYHQATEMRGHILREADRFTTMRLVLDHLANDLRAAQPLASPGNEFSGDSNSMSFVKVAFVPPPPNTLPGTGEPSDLVLITLTTLYGTNGTAVAIQGLDRVESPLTPPAPAAVTNSFTNSLSLSLIPTDQTNQVTDPFAALVRFVRFRYWDGLTWQLGWTNATPPPGVEIVLATDPLPDDAAPDAYPPEPFRRVVFLPGGMAHPAPDSAAPPNFASR